MTTPNGHHQVDVFEGVELPPDAETQALLELMALADDVEAGRLTEEGHRRARAALAGAAPRRGTGTVQLPAGGGPGADQPAWVAGDTDPGD